MARPCSFRRSRLCRATTTRRHRSAAPRSDRQARSFLRRTLLEDALEKRGERLAESDHKSALQEFLQGRGRPPAEYRLAGESGPDHRKKFQVEVWVDGECLAAGQGSTKKEAEQQAADRALERLETSETRG